MGFTFLIARKQAPEHQEFSQGPMAQRSLTQHPYIPDSTTLDPSPSKSAKIRPQKTTYTDIKCIFVHHVVIKSNLL